MAVDSLRLDQILRREITITWLEGIAVMQTICRDLPGKESPSCHFPLAMEVALTADGRVTPLRSPSGTPGVVAAGRLLGELLQDGDVPVRLRLIQSESVASAPVFQTVKELSDALAYFERPDTPQLLQQLFARAAGIPDSLNPSVDVVEMDDFLPEEASTDGARASLLSDDDERPDLKPRRLVQVDAAGRPPQDTMPPPHNRIQMRRNNLTIVAGLVGLSVLASGAYLTYGREGAIDPGAVEVDTAASSSTPAPAPTTGATVAPAPKRASGNAQAKPDARPRVDGGIELTDASSDFSRTKATSSAPHPSSPVASGTDPAPSSSTVASIDPGTSLILPFIARETETERGPKVPPIVDESGELLYSRVNAEVRPPTAIRPHLPSEPPLDYAADHLMVLELVITGKGDVESVRLLTAPKTVNDFMIVSAAKAWLFAPAKLNGRPVKYRHRIRFVVP